MKKTYFRILFIAILLTCITYIHGTTQAAVQGAGFDVEIVPPDNQENKSYGYYDLMVTPGQKQTLKMKLVNQMNEEITLQIRPMTAATSNEGMVDLTNPAKSFDASLKYPFSKMGIKTQKIKLAANETRVISLTYTTPTDTFKGQIVGAINVKRISATDTEIDQQNKAQEGVSIENVYSISTEVMMRQSKLDVPVKLKVLSVGTGLDGAKNPAILVKVQNKSARLFGQLTIETQIVNADNLEVVYKKSRSGLSMAPNSNFNFAIPVGSKRVEAGSFNLKFEAKSGTRTWKSTNTFTISPIDADKINSSNPELPKDYRIYWIIGIGSVILLFVVAMVLSYYIGGRKGIQQKKRK